MKQGEPTDTHAPHRIAVIGRIQANEHFFPFLRGMLLLPILNRHFQGHFHGRRAVVRVEYARQAFRGDLTSSLAKTMEGGTGCAQ